VWIWTRAAEFQWDSRAREPGGATEESDGERPVFTQQERLRTSQQPATSTQQERLRTSQQPATSTQQERLRTSQQPATFSQQERLRTSQQPATSTQQERLRTSQQPATSTRQEHLRMSQQTATSAQQERLSRSARREVSARYEQRSAEEFEDGQVRQAGLTRKLPSPALKEAEHFGSYNLRRFEHPYGGNCTTRHRARTHSGTSNVRRTLRLCGHLIGYAQGEKGVFETLTQGTGGVYRGRTSRLDPTDHRDRTRKDGISRPWRKSSWLAQRYDDVAGDQGVFTVRRRSTTVGW
jgi:hypothetical protein